MRLRDDLVEVVLEDEDDLGTPARPGVVRRWLADRRPSRVLVAAALAVTTAVAVGAQGAGLAARERRIAGATGLVRDLDRPLVTLWQTDAQGYVGQVDDLLLLNGPAGSGVVAVDPATGAQVWAADGPTGGWCSLVPLDATSQGWPPSSVPVPSDRARVLCQSSAMTTVDGHVATEQRAVVLDAATGAVVGSIDDTSTGTGSVLATFGEVLALGTATDGAVHAGAWSLVTGDQLWSWTGTAPRDAVQWLAGADRLWLDGTVPVVLDVATGHMLTGTPELTFQALDLGGGLRARTVGDLGFRTQVVVTDARGDEVFRDRGYVASGYVVDGGPHDVLVGTPEGTVVSLDRRTWQPRWEKPLELAVLAQVGGVLLLGGGAETVAVDEATGEELWTWPTVAGFQPVVSDGTRVGFVEQQPSGPAVLVVRDLRTGAEVRRQELPLGDWSWLVAIDGGRMLQQAGTGVAVLAPAP